MGKTPLLLVLWGVVSLLGGCVPTWGTEVMGQGHLKHKEFIDLNTVPEQEEAQKSRGLHQEDEEAARYKDLKDLEKTRLNLQETGESVRQKAFSASPSPEKKETEDGKKSRS